MKKCTKCKSKRLQYIEVWNGHTITFQIDEFGDVEQAGVKNPGYPAKVVADCLDCGHYWTVPGKASVHCL